MIRVLRVLEYEYPNFAAYELDRTRWTHELPVPSTVTKPTTRMTSQVVRVQEITTPSPLAKGIQP